jgi:uncharacterized protein (TIGR03790 family)
MPAMGLFGFIACLLLSATTASALQPDELLLIVNRNEPAGLELAEFYVKARQVPEARVLVLELPKGEEIDFDTYERQVEPAVRKFLRDSKLEGKVRCLVPMFGMPLRIAGRPALPETCSRNSIPLLCAKRTILLTAWRIALSSPSRSLPSAHSEPGARPRPHPV